MLNRSFHFFFNLLTNLKKYWLGQNIYTIIKKKNLSYYIKNIHAYTYHISIELYIWYLHYNIILYSYFTWFEFNIIHIRIQIDYLRLYFLLYYYLICGFSLSRIKNWLPIHELKTGILRVASTKSHKNFSNWRPKLISELYGFNFTYVYKLRITHIICQVLLDFFVH